VGHDGDSAGFPRFERVYLRGPLEFNTRTLLFQLSAVPSVPMEPLVLLHVNFEEDLTPGVSVVAELEQMARCVAQIMQQLWELRKQGLALPSASI
jgi:hypothetical protein